MTHPVWTHFKRADDKGIGKDPGRWPVQCRHCISAVVAVERSRQLNIQNETGARAQTEEEIYAIVVLSDNPKPFSSRVESMLKHLAEDCNAVPESIKIRAVLDLAEYRKGVKERALDRIIDKENIPPSRATQGSRTVQRYPSDTTVIGDASDAPHPAQRMRTEVQQTDAPATFEHIVPETWSRERVVRFAADLCRLMVVCNIAWCSVEHPYWRYFFTEWLPGMPIPGRKELSGRILDEQVTICVEDMKTRTGGKFATGQCDGWKDITRKNIIASMWNVEYTPYLVNTDDVSGQPKNAENLLAIVLREIAFALEALKLIVVAWCTDASGESAKMRRLLVQRMPHIIGLDCWAHQINLVVGDMLKASGFFTSVIEDALDIVKWFNNHSLALGLLHGRMEQCLGKILALVLPILTRWTSHYLSVRRLLEVARPLRELALDPALLRTAGTQDGALEKVEGIIYTLLNQDFWKDLERAKAHLEPLAMAANVTQSDCARLDVVLMTLANLFHYFATHADLDRAAADAVQASLERRWAKADQDIFLLALVFNPFVRVACFAEASPFRVPARVHVLAKRAFQRFYGVDPGSDFQNELTDYLQAIGLWTEEGMQLSDAKARARAEGKEVNLVQLWRGCAPISSRRDESGVPPSGVGRLCVLAARILSIVPNSAAVERIFSLFGIVHTRLRNRLGADKARKEVLLKVDTAMRFGRPGTGRKRQWLDDDNDGDGDDVAPPRTATGQRDGSAAGAGTGAGEGSRPAGDADRTFRSVVQGIMDELDQETADTPPAPPRPDNARARLLEHLFDFPSTASPSNKGLQYYWTVALRNLEREAAYQDEHHDAVQAAAAAAAGTAATS